MGLLAGFFVSQTFAAEPASPRVESAPVRQKITCQPLTGASISAEEVLRKIEQGQFVDLSGYTIEGSLDADLLGTASDERTASLRVLRSHLRLTSSRITGRVALSRTVLLQGIDLTCSEILGDLDLSDAEVRTGVIAPRARVMGDLRLARTRISGPLTFADARIEGRVDLSGARVDGLAGFAGAQVQREVDTSHAVLGALDISAARVTAALEAQDLLILSRFSARETVFERGMALEGVRTLGTLDLNGAGGPAGLSLVNCTVGEDLLVSSEAGAPLTLEGCTVAGDLSLLDGVFGPVRIERTTVGKESEFEGVRIRGRFIVRDTDFGKAFHATEALFEGPGAFTKVRFPGDDPFEGALFSEAPVLVDTVLPRPPEVRTGEEGEPADDEDLEEP